MSNYDVDVLIVGGGPTGTFLALELAVQGVSFRVVDKQAVRSDKSRALAVQPRSLEMLNRHGGIGHDLVSRGQYIRGLRLYVNRKQVTDLNLDGLGAEESTQFTLPLMVPQSDTEAVIDACLARHGYAVERPVAATSIVQDADGVTTTLEHADGSKPPETVRSRYVVGCDGAHSVVRHAAEGLKFEGAAYTQEFTLCDARFDNATEAPAPDHITMCTGSDILGAFPLPDGVFRLVTSVDVSSGDESDESGADKAEPTVAEFQAIIDKIGVPGWGTIRSSEWLARFRLHHRAVNSYRDGRLFVAGDAAHIHSPVGGQGMNTGIQDAVNLGWKLGAVLRGESPPSLLDTYDTERRPVGEALLRTTDRAFAVVVADHPLIAGLRNALLPWILPVIAAWKSGRKEGFKFISEFGITFRDSPAVGTGPGFPTAYWSDAVVGGDRAPDGGLQPCSVRSTGTEEDRNGLHLQDLFVPPGYHLLLFAGGCSARATEDELSQAVEKVAPLVKGKFDTHVIYSSAGPKEAAESPRKSSYIDPEGKLHQRYGFAKQPGYVYVRPDGYVAHIGLLKKMDGFLSFLKR